MVVGFDIDGVLYPWHERIWEWYKDNHNENMTFKDFWRVPDGFIAKHEGTILVDNLVQIPFIYNNTIVNESVVNAVKRINNISTNIYYITARPTELKRATKKWLKTNGFPRPENLVFSDDFGDGKVTAVKRFGCNYYVEDRIGHALDISESGIPVFLVNQPYNIGHEINNNIKRVQDVQDVADILENI